jgi:hypothetical protein
MHATLKIYMGETSEIWGPPLLQVQNQTETSEQAGAPVVGHRRPSRLLLVIDAGQ